MTGVAHSRAYRASRWLAVRLGAFALRHGITDAELLDAIRRAYPHRAITPEFRLGVVNDSHARNDARLARKWAGR